MFFFFEGKWELYWNNGLDAIDDTRVIFRKYTEKKGDLVPYIYPILSFNNLFSNKQRPVKFITSSLHPKAQSSPFNLLEELETGYDFVRSIIY